MRRALLVALAVLLPACPSNLEEQSHVSKLRVLAVRADPPELVLEPDGGLPATTLTALAVQPGGAAISILFALCTEITSAPSPTLPCPGSAGIELPDAGPLSARLDLGDSRIVAFASQAQLDGGAFDGGGGVQQALDDGVPLLIGFRAAVSVQRLDGFATVTLRSTARGPVAVNPQGVDLQIGDGGDISPKQVVRLQPMSPPKDDPSKKYGFSFFATAGSISSLRSTDTTATGQPAPTWVEWTAPDSAPPDAVRFWVVLRDGRGGTAWVERSARVR
jgi:hypothetical protein